MIYLQHYIEWKEYKKILFLDRDGVINVNRQNYVRTKEQIEIIMHVEEAFECFHNHGIGVVIVTNQQMVGKNIVSLGNAIDIHMEILKQIHYEEHSVLASFICPHLESAHCRCRKPNSLMIERACELFHIKANETYFIGDSESDMQLAVNNKMSPVYVGTSLLNNFKNLNSFDSLYQAANWICKRESLHN